MDWLSNISRSTIWRETDSFDETGDRSFRPRIQKRICARTFEGAGPQSYSARLFAWVRFDILFWNQAAADVFGDFEAMPVAERNSLYQMFANPSSKKKYLNWEADARKVLENFRSVCDLWSHAPEFNDLVESLSSESSDFRKWWNTHEVRRSTSGQKIIRHPTKGKLILEYSTFQSNDNPDLKLVLCTRIHK